MTVIIILAFVVAVCALGHVFKINYGLLGIIFAFIAGCLVCGFSPNTVIGFWSTKLFFQMFSITFFYAFAINNGTLDVLTKKLVYSARNTTFLIPIIMFLVAAILTGIGPGSISMILILVPIVSQVSKHVGLHPAMNAIMLITGVSAGCWSPICVSGLTIRGLIEAVGYSVEEANIYSSIVFRNAVIASSIMFVVAYIVFRAWKCRTYVTDQPDPFTKQQKMSLTLIVVLTVLLTLPPVMNSLVGTPFFKWATTNFDPTFLAVIFGVISIFLKLGDEKKTILSVPWNTIIMVCGMGMIISVASEAGTMTYLSEFITRSFPAPLIPLIMALVAGIMSVFFSTIGVVVPALYPVIFSMSAATGASPALLFSLVPIASGYTGSSPFSLFGAMIVASAEEKDKPKLFLQLLLVAGSALLSIVVLAAVGVISD